MILAHKIAIQSLLVCCDNYDEHAFPFVNENLYILLTGSTTVCDALPVLANGAISYGSGIFTDFELGTIATYSCNEGYHLITNPGDEMRTCVDSGDGNGGVFDGAEPHCNCKPGNAAINII